MSTKTLKARVKVRTDTFKRFQEINQVLLKGEIGFEFDFNRIKIGDGTKPWNDLNYIGNIAIAQGKAPGTADPNLPIGSIWIDTTNNSVYIYKGIESNGNGLWIHIPNDSDLTSLSNKNK